MVDSKDRLRDRLKEREQGEEELFFAEKEREAIARLKKVQGADAVKEALGHCPRCGTALNTIRRHGVAVLQCPKDCGTWLDKGELEVIAKREHDSWIGRLFYSPKLDE